MFQGKLSQLKMKNVQGEQAPTKQQKMLKKVKNTSTKIVAEQSMSLHLKRKSEYMLNCHKVCSPTPD
jgi:hypothetical protein